MGPAAGPQVLLSSSSRQSVPSGCSRQRRNPVRGLPVSRFMRYAVLALLLYVSVTRGADPGTAGSVAPALSAKTFQTDEAAADSLWAYRNRFARSASHVTQRLSLIHISEPTR